MASNGIAEFLENKSILVTGCTGFLAKGSLIASVTQLPFEFVFLLSIHHFFSLECSFCGESAKGSAAFEETLSSA